MPRVLRPLVGRYMQLNQLNVGVGNRGIRAVDKTAPAALRLRPAALSARVRWSSVLAAPVRSRIRGAEQRIAAPRRGRQLQTRPDALYRHDGLVHGRAGAEDTRRHLKDVPKCIRVVFL